MTRTTSLTSIDSANLAATKLKPVELNPVKLSPVKLNPAKQDLTQAKPVEFSNIILWRHAEAEQADIEAGETDAARQLTHKGKSQAKRMARWLKQHLPDQTLLICSPALRTLQTAKALDCSIQLLDALKPDATLHEVISGLTQLHNQQNSSESLLIVGHQPWMGQLLAYLLAQSETRVEPANYVDSYVDSYFNEINIKKGAVWWLRLDSNHLSLTAHRRYQLLTVQTPSLL